MFSRMQWSKWLASASLFLVIAFVVKSLSTNRLEGNTGLLKENMKKIEKEQHYQVKERNFQTQVFKGNTNGFILNARTRRLLLDDDKRRLHSSLENFKLQEHVKNRFKPQGTNNQFTKVPQVMKQHIVTRKQTLFQSDVTDRKVLKDKTNIHEFSNPRKQVKKKIVPAHRIVKRNINTSKLFPRFHKTARSSEISFKPKKAKYVRSVKDNFDAPEISKETTFKTEASNHDKRCPGQTGKVFDSRLKVCLQKRAIEQHVPPTKPHVLVNSLGLPLKSSVLSMLSPSRSVISPVLSTPYQGPFGGQKQIKQQLSSQTLSH